MNFKYIAYGTMLVVYLFWICQLPGAILMDRRLTRERDQRKKRGGK